MKCTKNAKGQGKSTQCRRRPQLHRTAARPQLLVVRCLVFRHLVARSALQQVSSPDVPRGTKTKNKTKKAIIQNPNARSKRGKKATEGGGADQISRTMSLFSATFVSDICLFIIAHHVGTEHKKDQTRTQHVWVVDEVGGNTNARRRGQSRAELVASARISKSCSLIQMPRFSHHPRRRHTHKSHHKLSPTQ